MLLAVFSQWLCLNDYGIFYLKLCLRWGDGMMKYGSREWREQRNKGIKEWIDKQVKVIDDIPNSSLQALCYFSLSY